MLKNNPPSQNLFLAKDLTEFAARKPLLSRIFPKANPTAELNVRKKNITTTSH